MTILLTLLSFVGCFAVAYWLFGWVLAFIVVSESALISYGALIVLACVAMAIVSHGSGSNRWWGGMIVGIIACVAIQMLEPYVGVVRVVLALVAAIWATSIIHRTIIRRLTSSSATHRTP